MQSAPLISNQVTVDVLHRLFFSESKPRRLKPVDLTVLTYLVLRRCEDHEIFDSYLTIAERVCSDRQTVARSLDRLEKLGWVTVGGRGVGLSKAISINADAFPAAQPLRDKLSPAAKFLVGRYAIALKKAGKEKFPKGWLLRQVPSAQRILTNCGDDLQLARWMVGFAMHDPRFKARAQMSLYNLLAVWPQVVRAYADRPSVAPPALELDSTGVPRNGEPHAECSAAA